MRNILNFERDRRITPRSRNEQKRPKKSVLVSETCGKKEEDLIR